MEMEDLKEILQDLIKEIDRKVERLKYNYIDWYRTDEYNKLKYKRQAYHGILIML